jgi:hypothetical protein
MDPDPEAYCRLRIRNPAVFKGPYSDMYELFYHHLSFFNWKSGNEWSAPLERVSYWHWPGRKGVYRGFCNFKLNLMVHY